MISVFFGFCKAISVAPLTRRRTLQHARLSVSREYTIAVGKAAMAVLTQSGQYTENPSDLHLRFSGIWRLLASFRDLVDCAPLSRTVPWVSRSQWQPAAATIHWSNEPLTDEYAAGTGGDAIALQIVSALSLQFYPRGILTLRFATGR